MKTVFRWFDRAVYFVMFLCIAGFVAIAFVQVVSRFVLNHSLYWSEEMCRYMFVWMVFLGSGIGLLHRRHITIDVVPNLIPKAFKKYYNAAIDLIIIAFSVLVIAYGYGFAERGMRQGSPAMQIPLGYIYYGIVVGGAVMLVNCLRAMLTDLFALPVEPEPEEKIELDMTQEEFNKLLGIEIGGDRKNAEKTAGEGK